MIEGLYQNVDPWLNRRWCKLLDGSANLYDRKMINASYLNLTLFALIIFFGKMHFAIGISA